MDKWNMVKLSDVFTLQMGKTPSRNNPDYWNGNHKWLSIADFGMNGKYINKTKECITDAAVAESGIKATPHNTVVMSFKLSIGKTAITVKDIFTNEAIMSFIDKGTYPIDVNYIYHLFSGKDWSKGTNKAVMGTTLNKATLSQTTIPLPPIESQYQIADNLEKVSKLIDICNTILNKLDILVKSRFVEMFGDLHINSKGWEYAKFTDIADIDGTMTTDFEKYANYPHIGIDSIQKNTGDLIGYRTVSEDNVVSGKYLFSPKHIIYSKIRPNLNKVALPTFNGVCSADAYPILPIDGKCNRTFLAYVMRSDYFLNYILQFCMRTNLPKVNRKELSGFVTPLPSLNLQNQFADFVTQIDKSKYCLVGEQILGKAEMLIELLNQEYFG